MHVDHASWDGRSPYLGRMDAHLDFSLPERFFIHLYSLRFPFVFFARSKTLLTIYAVWVTIRLGRFSFNNDDDETIVNIAYIGRLIWI